MIVSCETLAAQAGIGVGAGLRAVDCVAAETTAAAFGRLFAPGGALIGALTILLTLFVAFFAIGLLLGRTSIGVRSITPRMMTLGLVLTFATSWVAYQSVVWNMAVGAPDQLAAILTGTDGSATTTFADKIDVVFLAIQEAGQGNQEFSAFSPSGMMWLGALLFLLGTAGVLVTSRIALAVLVAIGPVFVVMALFDGTRGLFTGWLKGLVMLALVPLFVVLAGSLMLELAVPVLQALTAMPGQIDPQAAMAFLLLGAVDVALMVMVMKVAGTMVAGWTVFGLVRTGDEKGAAASRMMAPPLAASPAPAPVSSRRTPPMVATAVIPASQAANDAGSTSASSRTVRMTGGAPAATSSQGSNHRAGTTGHHRAHGIGNRFRAVSHSRTAHSRTEKFS